MVQKEVTTVMWWNDLGAGWGWGGWLLALFAMLAFWGVVIAGVMALFRTTRPTMGPTVDAPPEVGGAPRNARQDSL